jgi:hypothetical protein
MNTPGVDGTLIAGSLLSKLIHHSEQKGNKQSDGQTNENNAHNDQEKKVKREYQIAFKDFHSEE